MSNSGWNRSSANQPKVTKKSGKKFSLLHGLIAGVVVVVLGFAVLAIFSGGEDAPKAKAEKDRGLIKEVTPAAAPTNKVVKVAKKEPTNAERLRAKFAWANIKIPDDWDKPYPPQAYWPDGRLKQHSRFVKEETIVWDKATRPIQETTFSNQADRDIAGMLLIEPGNRLVGHIEFDKSFDDEFRDSLKTPIVIDKENDTPAQQDLKQLVIETRKELKERMDKGESVAEIMNETRKQLEELGLYREEIKKMVDDVKDQHGEEFTEQDEKDLIGAANKMLEERGCKPLELPSVFLEQIKQY